MKNIESIKTLAETIGLTKEMQDSVVPLCLKIIDGYTYEYCEIQKNFHKEELIQKIHGRF